MANPKNSTDKNTRAWASMTEEQRNAIRSYSGAPPAGFSSGSNSQASNYDPLKDPESDEWYLDYIKQYQGTDWYQQLLNNPYLRKNNAAFSPNLGQSILEAFGDYSAQDNYYGDLLAKRNSTLAEIEDQMRQYKQNSPSNQASLMAAAGQNPDLLGTSGVAGAPENDNLSEPFKPSEHSGSAGLEAMKSFAGMFMQAYQFASGIAHDSISLATEQAAAAGVAADSADKMDALAMKFLKSGIGTPSIRVDADGGKRYVFPDLSLDKLDAYAADNFRGSWQRKQFKRSVINAHGSARHLYEKYGIITDSEKAKKAMSFALGDNAAYGLNYTAPDDLEPLMIVANGISKANKEIEDIMRDTANASANYDSKYFHSVNGALAGQAVNANNQGSVDSYNAQKGSRKIDEIINNSISGIMTALKACADKGGIAGALATGMILFYSAYRSNMLPSLPTVNIDRSSTTKQFFKLGDNK